MLAALLGGDAAAASAEEVKPVFDLTPAHLALLRGALISWDATESGAPSFDAEKPYGSRDLRGDVARLSGERKLLNGSRLDRLHRDMEAVLQIALRHGRLAPGDYQYPNR